MGKYTIHNVGYLFFIIALVNYPLSRANGLPASSTYYLHRR